MRKYIKLFRSALIWSKTKQYMIVLVHSVSHTWSSNENSGQIVKIKNTNRNYIVPLLTRIRPKEIISSQLSNGPISKNAAAVQDNSVYLFWIYISFTLTSDLYITPKMENLKKKEIPKIDRLLKSPKLLGSQIPRS